MPRYFFHLEESSFSPDPEGAEVPDLTAARVQAAETVQAILRNDADGFQDTDEWRLVVTDARHTALFSIEFRSFISARPPRSDRGPRAFLA